MAEPFLYGGQTILSHPIFVRTILPAILIFVIVFAILQKSKVLGDGKRQIDAIVSLVIAILFISFAQAVGVVLQLIPFLAVSLVVLVVLFILLGSFWKGDLPKGIQSVLMAIIAIAVVVAAMYFTGTWQWMLDIIYGGVGESDLFTNIIFIVLIAAAVAAVVWKGKESSS